MSVSPSIQAGLDEARALRAAAKARLEARVLSLARDVESGGHAAIARSVGTSADTVRRILQAHRQQPAGKGAA